MNLQKQITTNNVLAITIGLIYLWFGGLKFFAELSPAEDLAKRTIDLLTFGFIPPNVSIIMLAVGESLIGILLILNIYRKPVIIMAITHLIFTFSPVFFFPDEILTSFPIGLTLLGQYIVKNIVIIGALFTLYKLTNMVQDFEKERTLTTSLEKVG